MSDVDFALESAKDESEKIEVTPEMIAAGERALSIRFFDLCDGNEYPEIARTVYEAMTAVRRSSDSKDHKKNR